MELNGINIRVQKTERRKTLSIFIERDGSVRVLAPAAADDAVVEEAVRSRAYQIFSKLARWKELNAGRLERQFVSGQSFLYLGRNYVLHLVEAQDVPLKLLGGRFCLLRSALPQAEQVFQEFYRKQATLKIKERMKRIAPNFSEQPTAVKVLELQNRWASCTPAKALNFHWKCAMAPLSVLDYIIVHEMVHLEHPNHSKAFWDAVDKQMPGYRESEAWLKQNGVKMSL